MKISKFVMVAMIGVSALGAGAQAETQSAMAGHGWPNPIDACFSTSFAQVSNRCASGSRLLIVPIQVPVSANYQAFARAAGSGAYYGTTCQAMSIGPSNSSFSFSALRSTGPSTVPQTLTLGVIGVPPQGTVHFECQLGQWIDDFNGGASASRLINVELR